MERKISAKIYFMAAVITISIFLSGMMLGLVVEGKRVGYITSIERTQSLEFKELQLQYQFIDQLSLENNCGVLNVALQKNLGILEDARLKLENYDHSNAISSSDFELLKKEYINAQLQYWLLAKRTQNLCESDYVTILFFFNSVCTDCDNQGYLLTYMKEKFNDKLLVFAIDGDVDSSILDVLKSSYNVTDYPTLVVNDKKMSGFVDNEPLLDEICNLLPEECAQLN